MTGNGQNGRGKMRRRRPSEDAPELCKRIRADREAAGLSQEACARAVGVSLSTWRNWERNTEPQTKWLRKIPHVFGLREDTYVSDGRTNAAEEIVMTMAQILDQMALAFGQLADELRHSES